MAEAGEGGRAHGQAVSQLGHTKLLLSPVDWNCVQLLGKVVTPCQFWAWEDHGYIRRRRLVAVVSPVGPLPVLAQLVVLPPAGRFTSALVVLEGGSSLSLGSLCILL